TLNVRATGTEKQIFDVKGRSEVGLRNHPINTEDDDGAIGHRRSTLPNTTEVR
ncbi:hypothetical protein LTR33_019082, partial [Friedmanniomyces endolithicus]